VTIDIGANDLLAGDTVAHVAQNLGFILGEIRAAAPTTEIVVMGLYNPLFTVAGADQLVEDVFNPTMAQVASQFHAFFADPFPAINHAPSFPNEAASVCAQIAICTLLHDIHPFDNGYAAIANVIFAASGYARLD
jgi:hypothetical protein